MSFKGVNPVKDRYWLLVSRYSLTSNKQPGTSNDFFRIAHLIKKPSKPISILRNYAPGIKSNFARHLKILERSGKIYEIRKA